MTLVSIRSANGRLYCELSRGEFVAEGEARTILGALVKTYLKLIMRTIKVSKWRIKWTER